MSFVVTVSTSSVVFTPPNGAENAFAGQTIASATWNAINTDVANNGLAVVGKSGANTIKGNATTSAAVVADLTAAQINGIIGAGSILTTKVVVSFSNANTDNSLPVTLPIGFTTYRIEGLFLSQASASLSSATVSLFTAAGGTGTAIVTSSTAVTVVTSTAGANNNTQAFAINNQSTQAYTATPLFFRTNTGTAAGTGTVTLFVKPLS